jgi:lipoprotein-anchoring transpeptidase ErfK/SrfK
MSKTTRTLRNASAALLLAGAALWANTAQAQVLALTTDRNDGTLFRDVLRDQTTPDAAQDATELAPALRRQVVAYPTSEAPGTIVIDTPHTYLYFVLGGGRAIRYGIGVGREGFTWSGVKTIERKAEWPDWYPPAEMIHRQPYLPRFMAGGPGNPLGARALYLGGTEYRIHGTNAPSTIGKHVSSGCIRMLNEDVTDLFERAQVGTKVVVLPMDQRHYAQTRAASVR